MTIPGVKISKVLAIISPSFVWAKNCKCITGLEKKGGALSLLIHKWPLFLDTVKNKGVMVQVQN